MGGGVNRCLLRPYYVYDDFLMIYERHILLLGFFIATIFYYLCNW